MTQNQRTQHTHIEIWKWTLSNDAIASCFVNDVFDMNECDSKDAEYFWLGRIPCRAVRLVGLVVGVQVFEKRTVYSIDDGTAVIDCNHRHQASGAPVSPSKASNSKAWNGSTGPHSLHSPPPKPIAKVGDSVCIVGRILKRHDTRLIAIDSIQCCLSSNDEPNHWLQVCELHRHMYYPPDPQPFAIPQPRSNSTQEEPCPVSTTNHGIPEPQTPSSSSIASSSATNTPSTSHSSSSNHSTHQSPPRLRHPSRLHSKDLTLNTFRIYLKHYMDNAPPHLPSSSEDEYEDDEVFSISQLPESPSKRKSSPSYSCLGDSTPRPQSRQPRSHTSPSCHTDLTNSTPRPTKQIYKVLPDVNNRSSPAMFGFTLSYLRRVPELALLASRVVECEAKRRRREQRAKAKEQEKITSPTSHPHAKAKSQVHSKTGKGPTPPGHSQEGKGPKMKRLFRLVIRQLYDEGSIVLWDGPNRLIPSGHLFSQHRDAPVSSLINYASSMLQSGRGEFEPPDTGFGILPPNEMLWKMNSSSASSVSLNSTSTSLQSTTDEDDLGNLSDPLSNEESYVPLTPNYLSYVVEEMIKNYMASHSNTRSKKVVDGPTPEILLRYMKKTDGRWDNVSEWALKEALEIAKKDSRIWCIGNGKWELCG
ncbi:hypothetical protein C8Q75DRAFT_752673 [Abortiporus biennis]|nr:hypothetical protein C8Q75DRAFT_752673 [Abortiporus biennis]